ALFCRDSASGEARPPRDGPPTRPGVVTGASSHGHAALCAVTPPRGARTHGSAELRGVALVHANAQISPWVGGGLQIRTGSVALWVLVTGRRGGARPRALAGSHRPLPFRCLLRRGRLVGSAPPGTRGTSPPGRHTRSLPRPAPGAGTARARSPPPR